MAPEATSAGYVYRKEGAARKAKAEEGVRDARIHRTHSQASMWIHVVDLMSLRESL